MSTPRQSRRSGRALLGVLAAGAVVGGLLSGAPASAAPDGSEDTGLRKVDRPVFDDGRYIVVLRAPSATQYDGGNARFRATSAAPGQQYDGSTDAARAYTAHLRRTHDALARDVGASVGHHYTVALNGFVAELTGRQAAELATDRRVALVSRDTRLQLDTWNTPSFLGLSGKKGAWERYAGGPARAGAGTVVGILDSGIWPESKSFAGAPLTEQPRGKWDIHRQGDRVLMDKADGTRFNGVCMTGEEFTADDCNSKLIGARFYPEIIDAAIPEDQRSEDEYFSPRDGDGHGTHTASTAAGNHGVKASVEGRSFGRISGMAPGARIAAYKVCFSNDDGENNDCYGSMAVAAVDDAVADGVDVINYSISGPTDTVIEPVELAFSGAEEGGVFIAVSAGNSGPTASSVAHPSPWVTTVAASTHVAFENTLVLGNGKKIVGASIAGQPVPQTPLVDAATIPAEGVDPAEAALCAPDSLDDEAAAGKMVVCTRGFYDRVAKSAEVKRAGGVAMVLANPTPNSLDADFHSVPTVHVTVEDAEKIFAYLDSAGAAATAAIKMGNLTKKVTPIPQIAGFSSRGPSLAFDADIIKPDITAPGVSILAAVAPPTNSDRDFDLISGTSMASPHVAGLAAFMFGERPNWSAMQVKSAMMTTARSLVGEDAKPIDDAFAQGAGLVRPKRFFNPGLFVTPSNREFLGFLTGQGLDTGVAPVAPKDINQPSMTQGQVVNEVSFNRQFLATRKGTWKITAKVPGFSAQLSRGKLVSERAGDIEDLTVTFSRTTAPLGEFAPGWVKLVGPTTVRIPVTLRPVSVKAPQRVEGTGTTGSTPVTVTPGSSGQLEVGVTGLAAADTTVDTVAQAEAVSYCTTVAEGSKVLQVDLDATDDAADLDLYVDKVDSCDTGDVEYEAGFSATGAADESVRVEDPEPGDYVVTVDGYAAAPGESSIDFILDVYDVNPASTLGGFAVDPNPVPVVAGEPATFDAQWAGLDPDARYLGVLEYEGAITRTYVFVDTTTTP